MTSTRWILAVLFVAALMIRTQHSVSAADYAREVTDLTNSERAKQGLRPLVASANLATSAQSYATAMSQQGFFGHTGLDGSTFDRRDETAGYTSWDYLAENLAGGQTSPSEVVAAWLASPSHRANLLSPTARELGVGFAVKSGSKYGTYWVQEFGDRPNAIAVAQPLATVAPVNAWTAPTGFQVSGLWLDYLRGHGDVDVIGLPTSGVVRDDSTGQLVQYFQRAVLEWHPEFPLAHQIQRRLIGDIVYPGADAPLSTNGSLLAMGEYFPFSQDTPTGLGHAVADIAPTGQPLYFREFFDRNGGVDTFGYPKEEPKLRNGRWTQRFQAAVFEYHPENDRDGFVAGTQVPLRVYRVQLELLGDEYLQHLKILSR